METFYLQVGNDKTTLSEVKAKTLNGAIAEMAYYHGCKKGDVIQRHKHVFGTPEALSIGFI